LIPSDICFPREKGDTNRHLIVHIQFIK
jgi:hypothetical protein